MFSAGLSDLVSSICSQPSMSSGPCSPPHSTPSPFEAPSSSRGHLFPLVAPPPLQGPNFPPNSPLGSPSLFWDPHPQLRSLSPCLFQGNLTLSPYSSVLKPQVKFVLVDPPPPFAGSAAGDHGAATVGEREADRFCGHLPHPAHHSYSSGHSACLC